MSHNVLGLTDLVSVQSYCPVIPEKSDFFLFPMHSHPDKRPYVPLGVGWKKNCIKLWHCFGVFPPSFKEYRVFRLVIEGLSLSVLEKQVKHLFT